MASGELTAKAETGEFLVSDRSIKTISPQKERPKIIMQQACSHLSSTPIHNTALPLTAQNKPCNFLEKS